jgi:uncharacterized protein (TIRG00374 family)
MKEEVRKDHEKAAVKSTISVIRHKTLNKIVILLIKWTVAMLLIFFLVRSGRLDLNYLTRIRFGWPMFGILVAQVLMLLIPLIRWHLLTRAHNLKLGIGRAIRIGLMGYFTMIFIPASLGLEGVRILYLSRDNKGRSQEATSTIIMDRAIGLFALLVLAVFFGAILLWLKSNPLIKKMLTISIFFLVLLTTVLIVLFNRRFSKFVHSSRLRTWFGEMIQAVHAFRHHKRTLTMGLLLSFIGQIGNVLSAYFALVSLNLPGSFMGLFAVTPFVIMSQAIPLTPLGLGVTEGIASVLYPVVGLRGGAEVVILLRAFTVLLFALCGLSFLKPRQFINQCTNYVKLQLMTVFQSDKKTSN